MKIIEIAAVGTDSNSNRQDTLTGNSHGIYSIRDIKNKENFQRAEAMIHLMSELNAGIRSAEAGWIDEAEFRAYFKNRRNEKR